MRSQTINISRLTAGEAADLSKMVGIFAEALALSDIENRITKLEEITKAREAKPGLRVAS